MLLGACAVKLASSHIQALSLPRLTLDRASATIASVGAVAVLVFIGHQTIAGRQCTGLSLKTQSSSHARLKNSADKAQLWLHSKL